MSEFTIQVLENVFGKSGTGFNKKPIYKFTGTIEKFDLKAFEKRINSIKKYKIMSWAVATFFYSFMMRVALNL